VKTYGSRNAGTWDIFVDARLNGVLAPTFRLSAPWPTFVGPISTRGCSSPFFSFESFILKPASLDATDLMPSVAYLGMVRHALVPAGFGPFSWH